MPSPGVPHRPAGRVSIDGRYSYHALAGYGSDTFGAFNDSRSWRAALLGTVATGAVWLMAPRPAQAGPGPCTVTGAGIITCTGDQSAGITSAPGGDFDPTTTSTLNINSLTTNIGGLYGIYFHRTGASNTITINSDTAPHSISATVIGIDADADDAVGITHTGDISAGDTGISGHSGSSTVTVDSTGNITATNYYGIHAVGSTGVTITHSGDISSGGTGISGDSGGGTTYVKDTGNITAGDDGIYAGSFSGAEVKHYGGTIDAGGTGIEVNATNSPVSVTNHGSIAAGYRGIYAITGGDIDITQVGSITATAGDGIRAHSTSGTVDIDSTGDITANGATAHGIYAHSTNGAVNVTGTGDITAGVDGIHAYSAFNTVSVTQTGDITAAGYGIFAQANTSTASVTDAGNIVAQNDGIYAYSYNGTTVKHYSGNISSATGDGIYARSGDNYANVTNSGNITAAGDGIFAKSYGTIAVTNTGNIVAGGDGIHADGDDDPVEIHNTGNITADGDGIDVSSDDGAVKVYSTGDIASIGNGIKAQSVSDTVSITSHGTISAINDDGIEALGHGDVTVDQTGNVSSIKYTGIVATSSAGAATVDSTGDIKAGISGIRASGALNVEINHRGDIDANAGAGIFAGSGGGLQIQNTGDIRASDSGIRVDADDDITIKQTGDVTAHSAAAIRANSANGGIQIEINGDITANANGIYAKGQSNLTFTHSGDIVATGDGTFLFSYAGTVQVGNSGNVTADNTGIFAYSKSGAVTVAQTGDVTTTNSNGILARSLDGTVDVESSGQIIAGLRGIVAYGTDDVSVLHTGNITASSDGVFAASTTGNITVMHSGDIFAANGNGIYAKSATGNINITVNSGTVYSAGGAAYAGIQVAGGSLNTITIGKSATVSGKNWAILGGTGVESIVNYGTVVGNVDLGGGGLFGTNSFFNRAGGRFESGATVDIGTGLGSTFFNAGTLSPGGAGAVQTSTFTVGTGLLQGASGSLEVDVDLANAQADRVTIAGTSIAQLAGTVKPHLMSFGATPQTFTILSAFGVTNQGLTLQDSAVVDYRLIVNPGDVQLQIAGINFAPSGLTPNQQATATNLQQSFLAGGGDLSELLLFLANEDFAAFAADLDHLHPEAYLAQTQALLWSGFDFGNSLFSCPTPLSGASLMGEESCYWLRPSGRVANLSSHDGYFGFRESAAGLTGGVQGEIAPHWYLDMGAGYERSDIDTDTSSARGHVFHGGAALKYIRDRWLFAGSLSGAFARYDTNRFGIPTAGTATADADTASLDARLRVAYTFGTPSFYMKPMVDFDLVGLWRGAIDETGADALNLHIEDETDWIASAAPAVEFGRQWRHGDTLWRPYVRLGVRFLSEGSVAATASFAGAPAGVPAFTVTSPLDRTLAEVSAGFDVWQSERFSLRVSYDGRFGANTSDNGGALKLRARF